MATESVKRSRVQETTFVRLLFEATQRFWHNSLYLISRHFPWVARTRDSIFLLSSGFI
jgi:hypothetical protein